MNIRIEKKLPYVQIGILDKWGQYQKLQFLVDTGFNGIAIFITDQLQFLSIFDLTDLYMLPEKRCAKMADGTRVETYSGIAEFQFENTEEPGEVLLVDSKNYDNAILGMDFLKQNQKRLLLDFQNQVFSLT